MINPFVMTVIGIIGGGQLGRMMAQSAKKQGYRVVILDPVKHCPAAQVCDEHIMADYSDREALKQLATLSTVVTYEFENIDLEAIEDAIPSHKFPQGTKVLAITQNRLAEKCFLEEVGVPVGEYLPARTNDEFQQALLSMGLPCVLKTTRFGYDGKGQVVIQTVDDIEKARLVVSTQECVLEKWVAFDREVSIMISRNQKGDISVFPISENKHQENRLHLSIIPAQITESVTEAIRQLAYMIADKLNLVGTLGIEFFVTPNGILVNELAPRPHNSGHYSIEACSFSQFDTSIQSVLNLPMPTIRQYQPAVMVNILGQHIKEIETLRTQKNNWHFHDYGKLQSVINRKMGHITILGSSTQVILEELSNTGIWN